MRTARLLVAIAALSWTSARTAHAQIDAGPTCDGAEQERCNCRDDDCDGATDEAGSCSTASQHCSPELCRCLSACRPGTGPNVVSGCGIGEVCIDHPDGKFCEPWLCRESTCDWDAYCVQTAGGVLTCNAICDAIVCGPCQTCDGDECVTTCEGNEICVNGACVARNCGESYCASPQLCCGGRCEEEDDCQPPDSGGGEPATGVLPGDGGCTCSIGAPRSSPPARWMLLALAIPMFRRRRRRV